MNISTVCLIFISAIQLTSSLKDCKTAPKDVVFLLDTSGSVGLLNFNMTLKAIKSFISMFDIGPRNTRVGIETFATSVNHQFALGDHQTIASLITAINKIPYQSGGTQITTALAYAATNSFKTGGRSFADKILILVTDGRSYDINTTVIQANNLQKQGINVFCLGVGAYVDIEELQAITKHRSRVLQVQDFNTLSHFIGNFRSTVCKELNQVMTNLIASPQTTTLRTKPPTTSRTTIKTTIRRTTPTTTSSTKTTTAVTTPTTTKITSPPTTTTTTTTILPTRTRRTTVLPTLTLTTAKRRPLTTTSPTLPTTKTTTTLPPPIPTTTSPQKRSRPTTTLSPQKTTSQTSTRKAQKTTPFYLKEAFHWIEYVEVGILSLVTVVVVGSLSCFCRFCFFFLKKREDDSEERKQRRKPCKRPAGWPT